MIDYDRPVFAMDSEPGAGQEIDDGVFAVHAPFWGFPNVVYLLKSGVKWAMVDAGIHETPRRYLTPFFEAHDIDPGDIELAIGTHGHFDHIGGFSAMAQMSPNIKFAIGRGDSRWAENPDRHIQECFCLGPPDGFELGDELEAAIRDGLGKGTVIHHLLHDGDELAFGDGRTFTFIHLGAHSPGQTAILDQQTSNLFTGDALQLGGIMNTETGVRDFANYRTVQDYRRSLERIERIDARQFCTSHAGFYSGDGRQAVLRSCYEFSANLDALVRSIAEELGRFCLSELAAGVAHRWTDYQPGFSTWITCGEHLDDLTHEGAVSPEIVAGTKYWTWRGDKTSPRQESKETQ